MDRLGGKGRGEERRRKMKKQEKGCRGKGGGIICPLLQKFLRAPMLLVAKLKDGFCCRSRFRLQLAM